MVDPTKLRTSATKIDQQTADYQRIYNQLYNQVSSMAAAWKGKDNLAFTEQIEGFKDDFEKMSTLMKEYAEFLRQSAQVYETTQADIVAQARRLTN